MHDVHPLARELEVTRAALAALTTRNEALERRLALRASVEALERTEPVRRVEQVHEDEAAPAPLEPAFVFDALRDRAHANDDPRFGDVCQLFHQEWFGIRSAAGALPGHKLAIRADRRLRPLEVERVVAELDRRRVRVIVVHAWSSPMHALVRALRKLTDAKLFVVWHGTTAQWAAPEERSLAISALEAAREGLVDGWTAIRRGMELLGGPRVAAPQLLNAPPRLPSPWPRAPRRARGCVALAPSWNDLRKNLATNLLAAQAAPRVARAIHLADDPGLPSWLAPKLERVPYRGPKPLLDLMSAADLVLNATTIDCHPMVDLEALAVGTPTVRGPLFLDALEDHPYAEVTTVANVLSVADVTRTIERALAIPPRELDAMLIDYRERLRRIALDRYAEHLGV